MLNIVPANQWIASCKEIRILKSKNHLLLEFRILIFRILNLESTSRNLESRKVDLLEFGIHWGGILNPVPGIRSPDYGIRNQGNIYLWNPEFRKTDLLESRIYWCGILYPVSGIDPKSTSWSPESKTVANYITWGEIKWKWFYNRWIANKGYRHPPLVNYIFILFKYYSSLSIRYLN